MAAGEWAELGPPRFGCTRSWARPEAPHSHLRRAAPSRRGLRCLQRSAVPASCSVCPRPGARLTPCPQVRLWQQGTCPTPGGPRGWLGLAPAAARSFLLHLCAQPKAGTAVSPPCASQARTAAPHSPEREPVSSAALGHRAQPRGRRSGAHPSFCPCLTPDPPGRQVSQGDGSSESSLRVPALRCHLSQLRVREQDTSPGLGVSCG